MLYCRYWICKDTNSSGWLSASSSRGTSATSAASILGQVRLICDWCRLACQWHQGTTRGRSDRSHVQAQRLSTLYHCFTIDTQGSWSFFIYILLCNSDLIQREIMGNHMQPLLLSWLFYSSANLMSFSVLLQSLSLTWLFNMTIWRSVYFMIRRLLPNLVRGITTWYQCW